ncbi:hypothetical protein HCH_02369 [Hahella chejuensis KCTC 2396]|uniref:Uncharacterized protein n=1 Tax=Hahella chejuensis (strain KCTC 2396) TaxID=349521 RepID=Q2SJI7_HAHCH|nr:hypothetical protein [Hahella chejuensis]ABC29187.1 hypothetical protein HCH_02369 [Hahella chejuensis KCTC 2396]
MVIALAMLLFLGFFLAAPFWVSFLTKNETKEGHWLSITCDYIKSNPHHHISLVFSPINFSFGVNLLCSQDPADSQIESGLLFIGIAFFFIVAREHLYRALIERKRFGLVSIAAFLTLLALAYSAGASWIHIGSSVFFSVLIILTWTPYALVMEAIYAHNLNRGNKG